MKAGEKTIQDQAAQNYEDLRYKLGYSKHYHNWWVQQMIAMAISSPRDSTVLDNGCGVGVLFAHLEGARQLIGLDLSLNMLRAAPAASAHRLQGDSQSLPFSDEAFDVIFARSLLHHLPDFEGGIVEMERVLRPGGRIVLADTNRSILNVLPRWLAYRTTSFSDDHQNLDRHEYLAMLEKHFRIEEIRYFGFLAYPLGFPDMMGSLRNIKLPVKVVDVLIRLDDVLSSIPGIRTLSWGIMVSAKKLAEE